MEHAPRIVLTSPRSDFPLVIALVVALTCGGWFLADTAMAFPAPDAGSPSDSPPAIEADETTDLVAGQVLTITGRGALNYSSVLLQCAVDPLGFSDCDAGTETRWNDFERSDDWRASFRVQRAIDTASGTIDCASEECGIALLSWPDGDLTHQIALSFDRDVPAADRPDFSVRPRRNLVDNQSVTMELSGLRPFERVTLRMCPDDGTIARYCDFVGQVQAEAGGSVNDMVSVRAKARRDGGALVDCHEERCVVVAETVGRSPMPVVLRFDPDAAPEPRPEPVVTLSKRRGLVDGSVVNVNVSNLEGTDAENFAFSMSQCALVDGEPAGACRYLGYSDLEDTEVMLRREIRIGHGDNEFVVDCADSVGRCVLVVQFDTGLSLVSKNLGFDPDVPPAKANVKLRQPNKLVAGEHYNLKIDSYLGSWVEVRQCPRDATSHEDARCQWRIEGLRERSDVSLDEFDVSFRPVRYLADSSIDCYVDDACDLRVFGEDGPMRRVLINFDATQESREPSVTLSRRRGLVDGQQVRLRGRNFSPNEQVWVLQCNPSGRCVGLAQRTPVASSFNATVKVRRFVSAFDCAAEPGSCELRVGTSSGVESSTFPLRFKETSPVTSTLRVSPRTDLVDDQPLAIEATPDGAVSRLQARQCVVADAEKGPKKQLCGQANGLKRAGETYTTEVVVDRVLRGVDCAQGPGRCIIQLTSGGVVLRTRPLEFRDEPLPGPLKFAMKVTPRNNLADGQVINVEVAGARTFLDVSQCAVVEGEVAIGSCMRLGSVGNSLTSVQSISVAVRRNLAPPGVTTAWDCAAVAKSCVIALLTDEAAAPVQRKAALTFDPDAESQRPTLRVTPGEGLVDGQEVTVSGAGWAPGLGIFVVECVGPIDILTVEGCDTTALTPVTVSDDGTFSVTLTVSDTMVGQDCRVVECRFGAGDAALTQTTASETLLFADES